MTTLLVTIRDDAKINDVIRFLKEMDFLDVSIQNESLEQNKRRKPAPELRATKIIGNIMDPVVPDSDWEVLDESDS